MKKLLLPLMCLCMLVVGCSQSTVSKPKFAIAWSEYPSWSVFGVAADSGLLKEVADKYGIEVEAKLADFDACIALYGAKTVQAVCITNMDILGPANSIKSTAILPTSTSAGADAFVTAQAAYTNGKIDKDQLHAILSASPTYGLEKSVSEYAWSRCIQKHGLNPKNYQFKNLDPAAAALAMQTKKDSVVNTMLWNPFVLQTLRLRSDTKVAFSSEMIPGEIIDMVVVSSDTLKQPGGEAFAACLTEVYYRFNQKMQAPNSDSLYVQLGAKFSKLSAEDMRLCCKQTQFFSTPAEGSSVYTSKVFKDNMKSVSEFCVERGIVPKLPVIGFDDPQAQLNFSTKYMK